MQTMLCFKPGTFFELCKYLEHFCEFTSQYKFEACYRYDIDFRLKIAAARTVAPATKTVQWSSIAPQFVNRYLTRNAMLPVCDSCQCTRHTENFCPVKKHKNKNRQASQNSENEYHPDEQFQNVNRASESTRANRPPCYRFNNGRTCDSTCQFPDRCNTCGRGHRGIHCDNHTSSRFRPQTH